jgi:apolipoprotein D and lipocalin family protein
LLKIICIISGLLLFSCTSTKYLKTVEKVDINKYMGTWYEIARYDHSFEKGLKCVSANYTLRDDGRVTVLNKGVKENSNEIKSAKGIAKIPDMNFPGILKVSFFRPFWGNYYIIELDEGYKWVLVGEPSRNYLWVLSREKTMSEETYSELLKIAAENGFDISRLMKVKQDCVDIN